MLKNQRQEGKNTVDRDETAHNEPYHLDLQCSQFQLLLCLALYGLNIFEWYHHEANRPIQF